MQETIVIPIVNLETWDAILALSEDALNLAIDTQIYHNVWEVVPSDPGRGDDRLYWYLPDKTPREETPFPAPQSLGTYSSVPYLHYTASWAAIMPLVWRYWLSLRTLRGPSGDAYWWVGMEGMQGMKALTEHEARVGLCRVALWCAMQKYENTENKISGEPYGG